VGRVKRVLHVNLTPFAAGLKETFKWYTKHWPNKRIDFAFEDKLIKLARDGVRTGQPQI
jgi:hypothetical protein